MKVSKQGKEVTLTLDAQEAKLLRRALERASFVDTPVEEQEAILGFCAKALEKLQDGR